MCGRFTLAVEDDELQAEFPGTELPTQFARRFNIAPSQPVLAIPNDGRGKADFFVWGLIPSWAKDPSIGTRLINARAETLAEKPAFKGSFKYKRCLILADGFYEWQGTPDKKTKVPYYIHLQNSKPFSLAGLWADWRSPDGSELRSCTIITTEPNPLIAPIHNRMPVIVRPEDRASWLEPAAVPPEALAPFLRSYPAELMRAFPVSTLVNNPATDRPECRHPA
ncbi:MAG TPA: SOS response-associated peptidase [Anaerolineales bacterium]|nr:SOS response-associated peptidase [Anaerolineales bacterium]